ncbi:hypothetical protein SEA_APOCALYPSE_40 [Mycobacterium phage Apocalypse]|uniref:Uncharacterized protein n=1 Tax=Mycobacterium phage Apocalypse TaxID=2027890 RepID=A0A249XLP9_9CAUD|nr:hypothetical protein I5G93_gp64 [Mycobacterium phage Apocalypse]ASZ72667.1 hypothetical protein SEA_APOCALYPSE_40 [Mycobacterium phage Apocalypse]
MIAMSGEIRTDTASLDSAATGLSTQADQLHIMIDGQPVAAEHASVFAAADVSADVQQFMSALRNRINSRATHLQHASTAYTDTDARSAEQVTRWV